MNDLFLVPKGHEGYFPESDLYMPIRSVSSSVLLLTTIPVEALAVQ